MNKRKKGVLLVTCPYCGEMQQTFSGKNSVRCIKCRRKIELKKCAKIIL